MVGEEPCAGLGPTTTPLPPKLNMAGRDVAGLGVDTLRRGGVLLEMER